MLGVGGGGHPHMTPRTQDEGFTVWGAIESLEVTFVFCHFWYKLLWA